MERPDFFTLKNGDKAKLPFSDKEYDERVKKLRFVMEKFPFISDAAPKSFSMKTILASIIGSLVSISKNVQRNLKY